MTRIVITGGPRTGKTTLANSFELHGAGCRVRQGGGDCTCARSLLRHTDDLMELGWSEASQAAALWLDEPGPWIIEGVAVSRALRKWRAAHPGAAPPVDRVIRLTTPHVELTKGQAAMAKGEETVWAEVEPWLRDSDVDIDET